MENNHDDNNKNPEASPYADETLIAEAAGDSRYLDRLVGLRIAERMLAEAPEDPGLQVNLLFMKEALDSYRNPQP